MLVIDHGWILDDIGNLFCGVLLTLGVTKSVAWQNLLRKEHWESRWKELWLIKAELIPKILWLCISFQNENILPCQAIKLKCFLAINCRYLSWSDSMRQTDLKEDDLLGRADYIRLKWHRMIITTKGAIQHPTLKYSPTCAVSATIWSRVTIFVLI